MKFFRTFIYTLIVLLVLSCNNEEIMDIENSIEEYEIIDKSKSDFEHNGIKVKDPNITYSIIQIKYQPGTTEFEKQLVRFDHGAELGLFSWLPDPLDANIENWQVETLPEEIFDTKYKQHLEDEDEVTEANWGS